MSGDMVDKYSRKHCNITLTSVTCSEETYITEGYDCVHGVKESINIIILLFTKSCHYWPLQQTCIAYHGRSSYEGIKNNFQLDHCILYELKQMTRTLDAWIGHHSDIIDPPIG